MLILQNITYQLPTKEVLLDHISFTIKYRAKIALVGNNGTGKSTLLKIISQTIPANDGEIQQEGTLYYIPQLTNTYDRLSVAEVLGIKKKIEALRHILSGETDEAYYQDLEDDWTIEERAQQALEEWQLKDIQLSQSLSTLSRGQRTKVFLAGISIHNPDIILMDEPSNHLDNKARQQLYHLIQHSKSTILIVSHDRELLNLPDEIMELSPNGIQHYGGDYQFYLDQKRIQSDSLINQAEHLHKELRRAKEKERESIERQQKLDARGKKKQEKAGVARIMMNTMRNKAERSTSKLRDVHIDKISSIGTALKQISEALPNMDKMKFGFENSNLHQGKTLFIADNINFGFDSKQLWEHNLNISIRSGERIAIKGDNGSGKTTFVKTITNDNKPSCGKVENYIKHSIYIDQHYSLINKDLSIYETASTFNKSNLSEAEIKTRLKHFLFGVDDWEKNTNAISGGEKLRLILCCLTLSKVAPDILILDEPTNNLDLQNLCILTNAINSYQGTLLVISHDNTFLNEIGINREITLTECT